MLAEAILVHGVRGYKFCWLLPPEDQNQGIPVGHESNGTVVGDHWEDMNQLIHQLGTNQKPDKTMTLPIIQEWSTLKMKLNNRDRSNWVLIVTKTSKDNDIVNCIDMMYAKKKIKISWPIGLGTIYDEN